MNVSARLSVHNRHENLGSRVLYRDFVRVEVGSTASLNGIYSDFYSVI